MFRLAEYEDSNPNLYAYLSSIASRTIFDALNGLFGTIYDVGDFYVNTFAGSPVGALETDFFCGLSDYISERSTQKTTVFGDAISEDGRAGMELMDRKIKRMKSKMLDPDRYYTFDLFEELLFQTVAETYEMIGEIGGEEQPSEDLWKKIKATETELKTRFDLEPDEAAYLAEAVHRIEKMGLEDGELFFWDDDFAIVFQNGFVAGIQMLISGAGSYLGYRYNDVCGIFTDAGIKAPLLLVGTEAAYQVRGDAAKEKIRQIPNPFDDFESDELGDIPEDVDNWPFS